MSTCVCILTDSDHDKTYHTIATERSSAETHHSEGVTTQPISPTPASEELPDRAWHHARNGGRDRSGPSAVVPDSYVDK